MSLQFDNPIQPMLEMPADLALWQRSVGEGLNAEARWRIYLQQLGWAALSTWLQEECDLPVRAWPMPMPYDLWHVVGGVALTLGQRRIVVVLDEAIDAAELRVPQEWIDVPDWVAEYYIAAYVDVDEQRLVPWGYTTHSQIKTLGTYDTSDRTYCLQDEDLVQDFSVFWVAQQLEQVELYPVEALPDLPPRQAENLIQRLTTVPDPRLAIPFVQWGALLQSDRWRSQLYQQRQGRSSIHLGYWMNQMFDQGWQTLESLLPATPALGFRSGAPEDAVAVRGKPLRLETPTASFEFVLSLAITAEAEDRRHIRIRLYPSGATVLPSDVMLTIELPNTQEPLQTVRSGEQDNYIQLPSFRCPVGRSFTVGIYWADTAIHEDFVS